MLTPYHAKYYSHELSIRSASSGIERLSQSLFDAKIDLNPHQIEAALFALKNPLNKGVIMADEVGLGKTIEAGLVLCQMWAERKRRLLIICPAALRKQWAQELQDKFNLPSQVIDSKTYKILQDQSDSAPLGKDIISIMSYNYATRVEEALVAESWDLVVIDEAHKLRNAHQKSNKTGQTLKRALAERKKLLLTATPLQNSLMEVYGLSTIIDEHLFGDDKAFRKQYIGSNAKHQELKQRLKGFAQRTLRKDVLEYIKYTERKPLTIRFSPEHLEQNIYEAISAFLLREDSYALPKQQRHLTGLVLRKLLASSTPAIINTLQTIKTRLEKLQQQEDSSLDLAGLVDDEEMGSDYQEAANQTTNEDEDFIDQEMLAEEINELSCIIEQAKQHLESDDAKAIALLDALTQGFEKMAEMGAPQKAIIFTESKRTQDYLLNFLERNGFADRLVAFSGTNNDKHAKSIYANWKQANQGSDKITGSAQVDKRTALIDHFRESADIMIATEAAAEGVNLQFCSLLINYDLPWNPQRVEQRIGRCHRYGQKFDVVVINFINENNAADQRVLELLTEKFQLFNGVFGSSDEILGKVEAGIDVEKRIFDIYNMCRSQEEIEIGFTQLQKECETAIKEKLQQTQAQLLEHFDEDIHVLLKNQLDAAEKRLGKMSRWFWDLSQYVLSDYADFASDSYHFQLKQSPTDHAPEGNYQLIRQRDQKTVSEEVQHHLYRLSHPLGEWVIEQGKQTITPDAHLVFNYSLHETKLSVLKPLMNQSGYLSLSLLRVQSVQCEEYLIFSALTDKGEALDSEVCCKLFKVNAQQENSSSMIIPQALEDQQQRRIEAKISHSIENNNQYLEDERDKLERWADDKILAAEQALEDNKTLIKNLKREARQAQSPEAQLSAQAELKAAEKKQRQLRKGIFDIQDEIEEKRDTLIEKLEQRMRQTIETQHLFSIRWTVC